MLIAFSVATAATWLLLKSARWHAPLSADRDLSQPQKFHTVPVPRIGGLAVMLGVLAGALALADAPGDAALVLTLFACAAPACLAGLLHDISDALSPAQRLLATALSAALAFYTLGAAITQTALPPLDWLVAWPLGCLGLTVLAVAGMAHAVNIVDGFNGLASMCAVLMLLALAGVALRCDDAVMLALALLGVGAVLGFFAWNYPAGHIFLGDGGAYFLGFYIAELALLLLQRHPGELSPLCPLLVCAYPLFETLFSIYRRRLRAVPSSRADGLHLHSLVYRRVTRRNAMTAPYLWGLCLLSVLPAVLFCNDTAALAVCLLLFAVSYTLLYRRIVQLRTPRWLRWPAVVVRSALPQP